MKENRKYLLCVIVFIALLGLSGCALLSIPGQLIGGTFDLLGKLLAIVDKLPKPPPGVF